MQHALHDASRGENTTLVSIIGATDLTLQALIVELMTCGVTSDHIFPFLTERLKEAGLHPVTALKESTGFIFNRIWAAIKREVLSVLAESVSTPDVIDSIWIEQYTTRKVGPW